MLAGGSGCLQAPGCDRLQRRCAAPNSRNQPPVYTCVLMKLLDRKVPIVETERSASNGHLVLDFDGDGVGYRGIRVSKGCRPLHCVPFPGRTAFRCVIGAVECEIGPG